MIFTERIEKLLASNHIKEVIDEFLKFLGEVPQADRDARHDANQLRGQVIILSGQFADLNAKINSGTIDPSLANREKSSITNSFVQILNQMPSSYPDLNNFIAERNEDDEWNEAQRKNTIEEYQDYFSKYPNGKYKAATIKLITELEEVKQKQDAEIKRLAALEKERRSNDKASDAEPQKNTYTAPRPNPAYRSASPATAATPAKSRTGLYIALGAVLGILFIIVVAISVSGDETNPNPVNPQVTYEPWSAADESAFLTQCQNTAVSSVGAERAAPYCDCMLQKIKSNYSSFADANIKMSSMTAEELGAMALDCLK